MTVTGNIKRTNGVCMSNKPLFEPFLQDVPYQNVVNFARRHKASVIGGKTSCNEIVGILRYCYTGIRRPKCRALGIYFPLKNLNILGTTDGDIIAVLAELDE